MDQIKWPTASIWFEETLEIFQMIQTGEEIDELAKKVNEGLIFTDKKEASAKRVWGAIKARYLGQGKDKTLALAKVLQSGISLQEKQNYAFVYYIEFENLFRIFLEEYVYINFNKLSQKTYTQMDLDKFFEDILDKYKEYLPLKLQEGITDSSMNKVRNMLYKNIATFGWGTTDNSKLTVRRPSLTPEWFTFLLYYFFEDKVITKRELYSSDVFKRFLLNEYDIEYLMTHAKMKGYIEVSQLGDVCNITKQKEGILDYAKTY